MAQIAGAATIILSEPDKARRELGRELGADLSIDPTREDMKQIVSRITIAIGADCALEAVGLTHTVEQCILLVGKGGIGVIAGVTHADDVGRIREQVVAREGMIGVRSLATMWLSIDHRVLDGVVAARFLDRIKAIVETCVDLEKF